ncbi:MAG TPA: DUF1080 domain-containing protein [Pirellulales bacterium]|jgi:hypothetical protein|nr:DUF1080 domain-containing protein [Pirellulales bacterium]
MFQGRQLRQGLLALVLGIATMAGAASAERIEPLPSVALFNGRDLTGWVNVNGAPSTWSVRDGMLVCSGKPSGFLRTAEMYENYILQWECRLAAAGGNSGMFVHADALPQVGAPYPRAIEVQLLDGDHGSIFGIRGATIEPQANGDLKGGTPRARPTANRCRPAGAWNAYRLTSQNGTLELEVNGAQVTKASNLSQRKGYIGLQSEGSEVCFRNLRVMPLPGIAASTDKIAQADEGRRSIFDGLDFAGWQFHEAFQGHWVAQDGVVRCDGQIRRAKGESRDLWTEREYGDFVLVADWRLTKKPEPKKLPTFTPDGMFVTSPDKKIVLRELLDAGDSGIYVRGNTRSQINIWSQPMGSGDINDYHKDGTLPIEIRQACVPKQHADHPPGQWNRFVITMRGDRISVVLNGEPVIDRAVLPGVPPRGRIALQNHNDPVEFRNLFIKELD